jgi:hypothetical protein
VPIALVSQLIRPPGVCAWAYVSLGAGIPLLCMRDKASGLKQVLGWFVEGIAPPGGPQARSLGGGPLQILSETSTSVSHDKRRREKGSPRDYETLGQIWQSCACFRCWSYLARGRA